MTISNRSHLIAEQAFLRAQLAELPQQAGLMRRSTQSRLDAVARALEEQPGREPARAKLTFNGRPVIRSYGLFADFGMKAVSSFTDAIAAVAASLTAPLAPMGPIPHREQNQMLITGTAVGSFGFELEEYGNGQLPLDEETVVQQALERTRILLCGSIAPDDEMLADAATDLDRRAIDKVRAFVTTLADNDAVCAFQYANHVFRFTSVGQVREALARLSTDNLVEQQTELEGYFEGTIPSRRTFEFILAGSTDTVVGKIGPGIDDPFEINRHLRQRVRISVMETRVGNGRPRYLLQQLPWIEGVVEAQ